MRIEAFRAFLTCNGADKPTAATVELTQCFPDGVESPESAVLNGLILSKFFNPEFAHPFKSIKDVAQRAFAYLERTGKSPVANYIGELGRTSGARLG